MPRPRGRPITCICGKCVKCRNRYRNRKHRGMPIPDSQADIARHLSSFNLRWPYHETKDHKTRWPDLSAELARYFPQSTLGDSFVFPDHDVYDS